MKGTSLFIILITGLLFASCKKEPVACIDMSTEVANAGDIVTFYTCSEKALSYHWTFEGPVGAPENQLEYSELQFNHIFNTPGTYTIRLTAYRNYSWLGESNSTERIITIN